MADKPTLKDQIVAIIKENSVCCDMYGVQYEYHYARAGEMADKTIEKVMKQMHDHINEMLSPISLCLYRLTPTEGAKDYGLADKYGDSIDIESVLKPTMDRYYQVEEE